MRVRQPISFLIPLLCGLLLFTVAPGLYGSDEPKWIRVSSPHFNILTDAGEKKGAQTLLRFEQMRGVIGQLLSKSKLHLSEPVDIIGFRSDEEYIQSAPVHDGRPVSTSGFFLAGDDRNYIVLDLADDKSWQTIRHDFLHMFLNCNYPPTQSWFDEGLAEYFSSLQLEDNLGQMGADPASFVPLLGSQTWLPLPQLFETKFDITHQQGSGPAMFWAESWIVMHYLISQDKMSETGAYFGLVQIQNVPPAQAIQTAYGVTAAQLEQTIKDYLRSRASAPPTQARPAKGSTLIAAPGAPLFTPSVTALDIGTSLQPVVLAQAQALVAEMMVRLPEHRDAAMQQLDKLTNDPSTRDPVEHRTLAWVYLEQGKNDDATEELRKAIDLDEHDPWAHFYFARMKYRTALANGSEFPGLANMLIDLRTVLDWDPDFAEAYKMLALGRVEGGGVNSAVGAMRTAVELSPRNETYLVDMALVYLAAKKWDEASALLDHLKDNPNPKIAAAAHNYIEELPNMKKYGTLPKRYPVEDIPLVKIAQSAKAADNPDSDAPENKPEPPLDTRKTVFTRGTLLRIDCSQPPTAVLTVSGKTRTLRLRTDDTHSLLLIGADEFSCSWKNVQVVVNYKAGGKADGDLVSLEIRQ